MKREIIFIRINKLESMLFRADTLGKYDLGYMQMDLANGMDINIRQATKVEHAYFTTNDPYMKELCSKKLMQDAADKDRDKHRE